MERRDFEEKTHNLVVLDQNEVEQPTDTLQDLVSVFPGIMATSEIGWSWLTDLKKSGCRIAENVLVNGSKQYKLIYPGAVIDLLDHEHSDFSWNEATGTISTVRACSIFEYSSEVPLIFQMLFHNRKEYRESMVRPSMQCFVSQTFADELNRRGLTGVELLPTCVTKRPAESGEHADMIVYRP